MNHQQAVHRLLLANGEMTSPQLAKASGLSYQAVRDACNRLLRKRVVAVVCIEDRHNVWASATRYLVEDARGEAEGSRRALECVNDARKRARASANDGQTARKYPGILRP